MSKPIDELVRKLRELLVESNDDVIAKMRAARDEIRGRTSSFPLTSMARDLNAIAYLEDAMELLGPPEEHECRFERVTWYPDGVWLECQCGEKFWASNEYLGAMYNAMRHLTPEMLESAAKEYRRHPRAISPGSMEHLLPDALRAAAAAMRKSASK